MQEYIYILILFIIILLLNSNKKIKPLFKNYSSELLTAVGTIGLAIVKIMSDSTKPFIQNITWSDSWLYLFIFFSLIIFIAIIISASKNVSNRTIQGEIIKNQKLKDSIENYKVEYYKLCSNNIHHLFKSFFTTGGERISIYKHQGDHFTLLGRCAKNPAHNKATDYQYSDNEGLIGKGWADGEAEVIKAPKWVGKGTDYKNHMKKQCNITDKRLKTLRMKSQSLYVKTLHDNNIAQDPDGIIVFESMAPEKVTKAECINLIAESENEILALLKNMKSLTKKNN